MQNKRRFKKKQAQKWQDRKARWNKTRRELDSRQRTRDRLGYPSLDALVLRGVTEIGEKA